MTEVPKQFDVLVVGAGPAGLAAAACAAESGHRVGLVDDNPNPGGQIWRGERGGTASAASSWAKRVLSAGGKWMGGMRVFHQPGAGLLLAESLEEDIVLGYRKLIIATGARERFLPFPGWTLPNVMGAGGLQAMVKSGMPIAGKRVVVAGSGPLLLAVAAYLRDRGVNVLMICEQATWRSLARFGSSLWSQPGKIGDGLSLRRRLAGIPYVADAWPLWAAGSEKLQSVTITRQGKSETLACDYLACGFHLVPNIELAGLLGCGVKNGCVDVDEVQQTSVPGIFCAGEPTGIGGLELALVEGQIAGLAAADKVAKAIKLFPQRKKLKRFAASLDRAFAIRAELGSVPQPETIVCRCEDVKLGQLKPYASWRSAKLQTRCGMGPCQGRICGPATQFLLNWKPDSVRPPIFPARYSSIAAMAEGQGNAAEGISGESR